MTVFGKVLRPLFNVSDKDASFSEKDREAAQRLEMVIRVVTKGCQLTLQNSRYEALIPRLQAFDVELRGFAYEGVGVGLAALDSLFPWKNRTQAFLDGPGSTYVYAVPLGTGMALARLRRNPEQFLRRLDPLYGWLVIDGYGFHQGFFSRRRYVERKEIPAKLSIEALPIFDNGVGRAIWFLCSTDVERVTAMVAAFPASRQAALWGGVGLACGYTGGASREAVETLRTLAGPYRAELATGAALAANARAVVGNPSSYVRLACEVLCGISTEEASSIVSNTRDKLPAKSMGSPYLVWRQRIAAQLTSTIPGEAEQTTRLVS